MNMETSTMDKELRRMRILLLWCVIFLGVLAAANLYSTYLWKVDLDDRNLSFTDIASHLDGNGEHRQLKALVLARLETHPNDLYAKWYLAEAQYKLDELEEARATYRALAEEAPNWESRCKAMSRKITRKLKEAPAQEPDAAERP